MHEYLPLIPRTKACRSSTQEMPAAHHELSLITSMRHGLGSSLGIDLRVSDHDGSHDGLWAGTPFATDRRHENTHQGRHPPRNLRRGGGRLFVQLSWRHQRPTSVPRVGPDLLLRQRMLFPEVLEQRLPSLS